MLSLLCRPRLLSFLSVAGNVAAAVGFCLAGAVLAQTAAFTPTWAQLTLSTTPPMMEGSSMVYDAAIGKVVLFGGDEGGGTYSGDTWLYDGSTWTKQSLSGSTPSARYGAAMAYDAAAGNVVLFGGSDATGLNGETWTYSGSAWAEASASTPGLTARVGAALSYNGVNGTAVLFGGQDSNGYKSDTWTWNGSAWSQHAPSASPAARYHASMAFDPVIGEVVLYGGYSGSYLFDTWFWNGTSWTAVGGLTPPSGRYGAGMDYDPVLGQLVLFGGWGGGTSYYADTWEFSGTAWTKVTPFSSPAVRYNTALAYLPVIGGMVLFGGETSSSPTIYLDDTDTLQLGAIKVGAANVCSLGTPTPCSTTTTLSFTFATGGTIEAPAVLTQGAANLDFTDAGTGTCTTNGTTHTYAALDTCTVVVTFAPKSAGMRMGAVELLNGSGALIATILISGTGTGPLAVSPGTLSTAAGSGNTCSSSTAACGDGDSATASEANFNTPNGVAVDAAGNIYIADFFDNRVRKVTLGGVISTVAGTGAACSSATSACGDGGLATAAQLNCVLYVAIDGAGNLYIADGCDERIRKVTAATGIISAAAGSGNQCSSGTSACGDGGLATASGAKFNFPQGVAVDGSGNLYISDTPDNRVRMVTASTGILSTVAGSGTACASPTASCGDGGLATASAAQLNNPDGLTVDASGNLYIADYSDRRIRKVTSTGILSTVAGTGGTCSGSATCGDGGLATAAQIQGPNDIALDAASNLYIVDNDDSRIRKVTASTGAISTIAGSGVACSSATVACGDGESASASTALLNNPASVAVDGAGNLYLADQSNNRIRKVTATASPITFATSTAVGTTDSTDGAQTVTISNNGNTALVFPIPSTGSTNPSAAANFSVNTVTSTCPQLTSSSTLTGSLASGASCVDYISFAPTMSGMITGSFVTTDNSGNISANTQSVSLSGTGAAGTATVGTVGFSPASSEYSGTSQAITISDTVTYGGVQPTGAVTFVLNGVTYTASCTATGSPETCSAIVLASTIAALAVNNYTVTAALAADTNYSAATGTSATLSITSRPPGYIWAVNTTGSLVKFTSASVASFSGAVGTSASSSTLGGVAADGTSHIWSVSSANNVLDEITTGGTSAKTLPVTGLSAPVAVAIDGQNDVWVANSGNGTVSIIGPATANLAAGASYGASYETGVAMQTPSSIAIDNTGGVWVTNKTGNSITHIIGGAFQATTPIAAATVAGTQGVQP